MSRRLDLSRRYDRLIQVFCRAFALWEYSRTDPWLLWWTQGLADLAQPTYDVRRTTETRAIDPDEDALGCLNAKTARRTCLRQKTRGTWAKTRQSKTQNPGRMTDRQSLKSEQATADFGRIALIGSSPTMPLVLCTASH